MLRHSVGIYLCLQPRTRLDLDKAPTGSSLRHVGAGRLSAIVRSIQLGFRRSSPVLLGLAQMRICSEREDVGLPRKRQ